MVARVVVDVPLAHLDRPFDYGVPDKFADLVQAGCRVRVRFSGQLLDGFVLSLDDASDFTGKLLPLAHVPSGEPVLTAQVARLARAIADRYAGTMSDVLRLALPPRRATPEKRPTPTPDALPGPPDPTGFGRYQAGAALLSALAEGRPARAVWTALPGGAVGTAGCAGRRPRRQGPRPTGRRGRPAAA
jgi:primosomal protein N' (replication factor Y)